MADNVIGIKFGVAGGKGFQAGSSGALIKEQLEYLASRIKLKVNINKTYFKNQLSSLKKELDKMLGELNINVRANVKPNVQGGGSSGDGGDSAQQVASYESVTRALEKLYQTKAKLLKMPTDKDGKFSSVAGVKANADATALDEQYKKQLEELEKLEGADQQRIQAIKDYRLQLEQAYQAQKKSTEDAQRQSKIASPTAAAKLQTKAASLYTDNGFDKIIARSAKAKELVDEFSQSVRDALNENGGELTKEKVEELNTKFLETQAKLKEIGRETDTVGNKIKEAFSSRVIQRIAQTLLLTLLRALRQVYQNVKEIDKAMTSLKIVTGATGKEMENAAKSIAKSAKEIGASVVDLTNSTTVYARLGYGLKDAETLAKKTTIYANVAGVNVNEATTNITGIIKAFNIGADGLESVLDQLIWVGNNFAISQAEIGEAMNNAASSLAANGNTLQESIGIITAANVTLQNVSKSSTAVRTIAARISASTSELQELGEDVGDILTTAKLDAKMKAFGVSISGANGELRSTYDILGDLAQKWNTFTDSERAAIANMLAGTRQQNAFYSIMQNWQDAASVVDNSAKGVGALQDAQETYLDSIDGKTNQLKAAWEEFSTTLLDSGIVKFFISVLEILAKVLNAIFSLGNGFIAKAGLISVAAVGLIALFKKIWVSLKTLRLAFIKFKTTLGITATGIKGFFMTVGAAMKKFLAENAPVLMITTIVTLMTSLEGKAKGFAELIVGAAMLIMTGIIIAIKGIDVTIKGFMASNPIGWILAAVTAVVAVVKGVIDLIKSFNPSYEDLKEEAKDSISKWKSAAEELDKVNDKLEEIQNKIDEINNKDSLSIVDKEQLKYLEQEKANLESLKEVQEQEAERAKNKAADSISTALKKYNKDKKSQIDKVLSNYSNASESDKDLISQTIKEYAELLDGFNFGDSDATDQHLEEYFNILDRYNLKTGNAALTWKRVLSDTRFSEEVEALQKLADTQAFDMNDVSKAAPKFLAYLESIGVYSERDEASITALVQSIKDLREKLAVKEKISFTDDIDIMQDKFDSLGNALKDIDSNGVISMDNISKIIDKDAEGYPTLLKKYFRYVEGVGYKLAEEWAGKSKTDILTAMAKDEIQNYVDELSQAQETLDGMTEENEDYETAVANVATTQENLNTKITEWATILREQALEDETERLEKMQDALEDQADKYKELIAIRKDLLSTYKEEISYQKELAKKQKAVADIQTQLSLAMLDKSASGQAKVRDLQEQLINAQDALDEYTLEKAIDDLTSQLDQDYDAYKGFIQDEIDRIVETINNLAETFQIDLTPNSDRSITGVASHHGGGFVGNMVTLKSNEEFAKLLNGELVSTPKQMDNFMRRTLPHMLSYEGGSQAIINNNSPLIEIKCGNIDEDTIPQLKNLVSQAVSKIEENMKDALTRTGYKKKY